MPVLKSGTARCSKSPDDSGAITRITVQFLLTIVQCGHPEIAGRVLVCVKVYEAGMVIRFGLCCGRT